MNMLFGEFVEGEGLVLNTEIDVGKLPQSFTA